MSAYALFLTKLDLLIQERVKELETEDDDDE